MNKELMVVLPVSRLDWEAAHLDIRQRRAFKIEVAAALLDMAELQASTEGRVPVGHARVETVTDPEELEAFPPDIRDAPEQWIFVRARFETREVTRGTA